MRSTRRAASWAPTSAMCSGTTCTDGRRLACTWRQSTEARPARPQKGGNAFARRTSSTPGSPAISTSRLQPACAQTNEQEGEDVEERGESPPVDRIVQPGLVGGVGVGHALFDHIAADRRATEHPGDLMRGMVIPEPGGPLTTVRTGIITIAFSPFIGGARATPASPCRFKAALPRI